MMGGSAGFKIIIAFAFGTLFESGLLTSNALSSAARDLDQFYYQVTATEGFIRKPAQERVEIMEKARKH